MARKKTLTVVERPKPEKIRVELNVEKWPAIWQPAKSKNKLQLRVFEREILAIVMTGQPASWKTFADDSPTTGWAFVERWIRPHIVTTWHAAKLMEPQRSGLIVELIEQDNLGYHGAFYFDLMETLLNRLVFALANELGKHGITAVASAPASCATRRFLRDLESRRRTGEMR